MNDTINAVDAETLIRTALKVVGEPASGHRMMSSRRDACTVWQLLNRALTALSTPKATVEREAIARIIAGPLCDATKGEHSVATQGNYLFCTQCGETISKRQHGIVDARNKADAIIAVRPDEAAIRADQREIDAKIADDYAAPNRFSVSDVWKSHSPAEVYSTAAVDVAGWVGSAIRGGKQP
jgi:hypothetical protein